MREALETAVSIRAHCVSNFAARPERGWTEARLRKLVGKNERRVALPAPLPGGGPQKSPDDTVEGTVFEYRGKEDHMFCQTQEGLGNKNWVAEWMYENSGTGKT